MSDPAPTTPAAPVPASRRWLAIGVAIAGAVLLAIAVQGGHWWQLHATELGDVTIGPMSTHRCFGGDCKVVGLGWIGGTLGWARAGQAVYAGALCAAALLVFSAASLAARRVIRVVAKSGVVAAITAAVAGVAFVALFPGLEGAALGRGLWLFVGGIVLAVAGQILILRAPVAKR
jgi:hypothetical protein